MDMTYEYSSHTCIIIYLLNMYKILYMYLSPFKMNTINRYTYLLLVLKKKKNVYLLSTIIRNINWYKNILLTTYRHIGNKKIFLILYLILRYYNYRGKLHCFLASSAMKQAGKNTCSIPGGKDISCILLVHC